MRLTRRGLLQAAAGAAIAGPAASAIAQSQPPPSQPTIDPADDALLEEIAYASFRYFVDLANPATGLVPDKTTTPFVCSIAAQGYAFAAWMIGADRGWMPREQAEDLCQRSLQRLLDSGSHHLGIVAHYIDTRTAEVTLQAFEQAASTIDSALMVAGALAAGEYFGGQVRELANALYARMDWKAWSDPARNNRIPMAWTPDNPLDFSGPGSYSSATWDWYTDETLLVSMLGVCAPDPAKRLGAVSAMVNWNRPVGSYGPHAYIYSWPGTLFTYTFAQTFFDFRALGGDLLNVNWWNNTRAAVRANRDWCRANAGTYPTFGQDRWGITACVGPTGYVVPGHQPRGASGDDAAGGTLAPYGAGMAVLWEPADAIAALRHMRHLSVGGAPVFVPVPQGGFGFRDAFNIGAGWVANDDLGIAHGPMLLCIENFRSGLVFSSFQRHPAIRSGLVAMGFNRPPLPTMKWIIK